MFIDKDSIQIKIPGGTYVSLGEYLTEVNYDYPLLFAEGSGRNLAGTMIADFNGIYPKIKLQFGPLSRTKYQMISKIINKPMQILKYYDPELERYLEIETYPNGHNVTNSQIITEEQLNEGFEVSFISRKKRPSV